MYRTMLGMHRKQVTQEREQHEADDAFQQLKAIRLHTTFATRIKQLQFEADERRQRWRAYRSR